MGSQGPPVGYPKLKAGHAETETLACPAFSCGNRFVCPRALNCIGAGVASFACGEDGRSGNVLKGKIKKMGRRPSACPLTDNWLWSVAQCFFSH